uniref:Uncharacterized protein n=1 Tax=Podarcis muralis TaxID=64176 RepID=A0A670JNC0_PODMU
MLTTPASCSGLVSKSTANLYTIFFLFLSAVFPVLFDCCTEVAHHIPRRWLRTVATFDIQNGAVGKKKMCVCVVCVQLWNGENDLRTLTNWNMSRGGQPKWSKAWKRCLMRNG